MNTHTNLKPIRGSIIAAFLTLTLSAGAYAAGPHGDGHGQKPDNHSRKSGGIGHGGDIGEPGQAADISRTIKITMTDNLFLPKKFTIKQGETIRFVIKNEGNFVHEFNIGTVMMNAEHRKKMMTMVEHGFLEPDRINHDKMKMDMGGGKTMEHIDPNSALLEPKKSAEIVWKFSKSGKFEFACNVPGHYESGMVGNIQVL